MYGINFNLSCQAGSSHAHAPYIHVQTALEEGKPEARLELSWVPQRWWKAVTGRHRRDVPGVMMEGRYLELCVLSCAMVEVKSGDLCIAGSE